MRNEALYEMGYRCGRNLAANPYSEADRKVLAAALRHFPEVERAEVLTGALAGRREGLTYATVTQREWQRRVSRRPLRGNHHDSWAARERYTRCGRVPADQVEGISAAYVAHWGRRSR